MIEESFMKSVFHGVIEEGVLFPYPEPGRVEVDNLQAMVDSVRRFCDKNVDSAKIDREHTIPDAVIAGMKELGLFGLLIPEAYGGIGLSVTGYARVMQEVAAIDSSLAVMLGAHQSIGLKGLLLFGTDEQKKKYLPKLATGEMIAAFALTEPGSGSDAASIKSTAVLSEDGSYYVLNGDKIWITNGAFADFFTVFAKTPVEEKGEKKEKITAFIVTRDMAGFSNGKNEEKLGIRGS